MRQRQPIFIPTKEKYSPPHIQGEDRRSTEIHNCKYIGMLMNGVRTNIGASVTCSAHTAAIQRYSVCVRCAEKSTSATMPSARYSTYTIPCSQFSPTTPSQLAWSIVASEPMVRLFMS